MSFKYDELLREQLYRLKNEVGLNDYEFEVDTEQAFLKRKNLLPNTIYILTKELQNEISIGVNTQPVQLFILSEQDSLDVAKEFFSQFANKYNFKAIIQSENSKTRWVKQQYAEPVVLSNFNVVDYGYRSVLYISVNLFIMENVIDLKDLYINNEKITTLTWDLAYSMTPNTQSVVVKDTVNNVVTGEYITKSVKSISTLAINITIPVVESNLTNKVLDIINEDDNTSNDTNDTYAYGGNENFHFSFYLGSKAMSKTMKLVSAEFGTAIDQVPTIRLGFIK